VKFLFVLFKTADVTIIVSYTEVLEAHRPPLTEDIFQG
jgi:hypothetical protein